MHKTYLDAYQFLGFKGGFWAYAMNTNDIRGVPLKLDGEVTVPEGQRRLAIYPLGWESMEVCDTLLYERLQ